MQPTGWAATDVGRRRDHNEDSFLCNTKSGLFAVKAFAVKETVGPEFACTAYVNR